MDDAHTIRVTCTNCLKRLAVKPQFAGQSVKCPNCTQSVNVPTESEGSDATEVTDDAQEQPKPQRPKLYAFACPNCGTEKEVKRRLIGKLITCADCEQKIRVPQPLGSRKRDEDSDDEEEEEAELSLGDWFVCIILPVVGLIMGFGRSAKGDPTGGQMIGYSFLFIFLWSGLRIVGEVLSK